MQPVPLLRELIAIDSTSSRSNLPVLDLLEQKARALGFDTRRLIWRDQAGVEKGNLVCRRGPDAPGGLALVGHTDCVPYDPEWKEALSGAERDGRVFGRGACDTKGFIAAALAAVSRAPTVNAPLWLVFTADEEVGCLGAKKLLEENRVRPRCAIVGEPTLLAPMRAHKGYATLDVEVHGAEAHSSLPDMGASAVVAACRLIEEVQRVERELALEDSDPLFTPPHTTFNVGLIQGGKARNIIPGFCRFSLEWRPIPRQSERRALGLVETAARRLEESFGGRVRVEFSHMRVDKGAVSPPDAEIVRFLERESGKPAGTVPFGTELPELLDLGAEACVFGPGDIRVAHRTGEHVEVAQLEGAARIVERAVERFCAER